MTHTTTTSPGLLVEDVDRDGALRDAAERVRGTSRAAFLAKGALATGAAVTGGGLLAATASAQGSSLSQTDKDVLNFALLLEYLESTFYADAIGKGILTSTASSTFATVAGNHEDQHVQALSGLLGSDAIAKPTFDFSSTNTSEDTFYATSVQLEDTGVSAYKGQAPVIQSKSLLAQALLIHSIEARHAAWVRYISGIDPVIAPVDKPRTKQQVLDAVAATGFVKSM